MGDKKYQIFISSTYNDLVNAREKIIKTILKSYHFPVGMEMFSADDDEQWDVIQDTIDTSDYYVLVLGHRYGSVTSDGISYTEKEYDYAKSQNIPILAFIRNRDVATKPHERDDDLQFAEKLNLFIDKASKSKMCDFWNNEDDLATKIAVALPKIIKKNPRIGWVRSNLAISPEVSEELAKLSKENRELRAERDQLKAFIEDKKPEISIKINGKNGLEVIFVNNEDLKMALHSNVLPFSIIECPKPISIESIPQHLKSFLPSSEIEKYNNSLPSEDIIDEYNKSKESYFRIKGTSSGLLFEVENLGAAKANDIIIDIVFPKEVAIMDKYDIDGYKYPDNPIPADPIKIAEDKYRKKQERNIYPISGKARGILLPSFNSPFDSIRDSIAKINTPQEINTYLHNNKITIRLESLLHTRKISIDGYSLIPCQAGQFNIQISVICEEYSDAKILTFPLIIKESASKESI